MIKAVLENGQIRPSCPLPAEWSDGQQLLVEVPSAEADPAEIAAWSREIEEAAQRIPDDDHARFLDALAEQKRIAKEGVRRQMGLDG